MPKFSIIVPVYNNEKLTKNCINSIRENTTDYEIIVIDNGSTPPYQGWGKIIRNNENKGFPAAVNQGLKEAKGEILIILNNDTLVTPHWADYFAEHLKKWDLIGPCTNNISGLQQISIDGYISKSDLYNFAKKQREKNLGDVLAWYRLVFFCVAFTRRVFDRVGLLDEMFTPGNFEDDDYCLRAIEANFKLGIAYDIFIHHQAQATHKLLNLNLKTLLEINQAKFNQKWPDKKYQELKGQALENSPKQLLNPNSPLSLVMIVKNEAKGIEKAILSSQGLVSNIIIAIDNATTDETEIIAKRYTTEIKHFDFKNDFAAARNFAQEGIKTEWILFLDGHEYIKQAPNLLEHLKQDCDGLLCTIEMDNGSKFRNPRIFKSHVKFKGEIHEQQQCEKILPYLDFVVKHDRQFQQSKEAAELREQQRNEQMPAIMGRLIKVDKKNTRASFHLALYYTGRQQFKKAKKYFKLYLKYSNNRGERWFVYFNIALVYLMQRKFFKAYIATGEAEREVPQRWEIDKMRGMIFFEQQDYSKALEYFVNSFHENTGDVSFKPWAADPTGTWSLIGESFFQQGKYFQAGEAFKRGAQHAKRNDFKDLLESRSKLMYEMAKR